MVRVLHLLVLLSALAPSAWYAWEWRSMPHAGEYHDDGLYYTGAKSIAETGQYRISSMPSEPAQTKFPPLWPAVLSIAWRLEPNFPDNLSIAMALCWIWLPASLFAFWLWGVRAGLTLPAMLAACLAWALNPYSVLFSTTMMSELLFTSLLLAVLLCLNQGSLRWVVCAGLVSGMLFLTRTAGLAILPAVVGWFLWRAQKRHAVAFAAAMIPWVAAWAAWTAGNRTSSHDENVLYYTNYLGYYLAFTEWSEFHLYIWKNVDGILSGLGSLVFPLTTYSIFEKVVAESIAILGIAGIVRVARREPESTIAVYSCFAALYTLILVVWNFPPTERFMLPVAPLWLCGLIAELRATGANIAAVFRKPEFGQKVAASLLAVTAAAVGLACLSRQWSLLSEGLPRFYRTHQARLRETEAAMEWIRRNLPASARVVAQEDPMLYLRTGRQGEWLFLSTIHWYRGDTETRTLEYGNAAARAKARDLDYLLSVRGEFQRDMEPGADDKIRRLLAGDARLERIFESGPAIVYRIR